MSALSAKAACNPKLSRATPPTEIFRPGRLRTSAEARSTAFTRARPARSGRSRSVTKATGLGRKEYHRCCGAVPVGQVPDRTHIELIHPAGARRSQEGEHRLLERARAPAPAPRGCRNLLDVDRGIRGRGIDATQAVRAHDDHDDCRGIAARRRRCGSTRTRTPTAAKTGVQRATRSVPAAYATTAGSADAAVCRCQGLGSRLGERLMRKATQPSNRPGTDRPVSARRTSRRAATRQPSAGALAGLASRVPGAGNHNQCHAGPEGCSGGTILPGRRALVRRAPAAR